MSNSKRLPNLSRYIQEDHAELLKRVYSPYYPLGGFGALVVSGLVLSLFLQAFPGGQTGFQVMLGVLGLVAVGGAAIWRKFRKNMPPTEEQQRNKAHFDALNKLNEAVGQRRLHRDLDYTVAQLLEAAAYYWVRVRTRLDEPMWNGPEASLHLRSARAETLEAVESGMREAAALGVSCIAPPGSRRSYAEEIFEDLGHGDIAAALDGFRESLRGKKVYRSENLDMVYEPLKQIAERLKQISNEVDAMTREAVSNQQNQVDSPVGAMEGALRSLRELRQAQQEIDTDLEDHLRH